MKEGIKRSIAVIILLALAVAAGLGADRLFSAIQSKNYPRAYSEYVQKYAEQYGVPVIAKFDSEGMAPDVETVKAAL